MAFDTAFLAGIRYLGADEVARAKGHDYLPPVYDLTPGEGCGRILWVKEGRDGCIDQDAGGVTAKSGKPPLPHRGPKNA
ncbi:MAG: hypothetical protein M0037_14440 [Betaproteobacteria bacterium]|nr:hypothetical protein [Betaproteobacteria bacterium]